LLSFKSATWVHLTRSNFTSASCPFSAALPSSDSLKFRHRLLQCTHILPDLVNGGADTVRPVRHLGLNAIKSPSWLLVISDENISVQNARSSGTFSDPISLNALPQSTTVDEVPTRFQYMYSIPADLR
jgi:hypothetical protein